MKEKAIALFLTALLALVIFGPVMAAYTLSSYAEPFCASGDCKNFRIVYGSNAKAEDLAGGSNIIASLSAESYNLVSTTGSSGTTSVTGGESYRLDASGNEWNYYLNTTYGEDIEDIDSKLTSSDLDILADGTFKDTKGTNKGDYEYTQKIDFTDNAGYVTFTTKNTGNKEADTYMYWPDTSGKYMFNYTLDFTTVVPYANAADIEQNSIDILGTEYEIVDMTNGTSQMTTLVLMGGASKVTGNHGETYDVTVGGTSYTVTPYVYGSSDSVIFDVTYGGTTETTDALATGDTFELADGNLIGLTQMATSAKEGVADTATFFVGADKITFTHNNKVKLGSDKVDGSNAIFIDTTGSSEGWDKLIVSYYPKDKIYLAEGEEWTDPIFGIFKFMFLGVDKTTEHIDIDPDGSQKNRDDNNKQRWK
jgi:hypothetical protein